MAKQPALRELSELRYIIDKSPTGGLKALASGAGGRSVLLALARFQEALPLPRRWQAKAYHVAISAHFVAGVRDGRQRFAPRAR